MNIVAVDTDRRSLEQLVSALRTVYPLAGMECFDDPLLALQYAYGNTVDILFTALNMSRLTGCDLARLVRNVQRTGLQVYLLVSDEKSGREAFWLHANGVLVKPLTPERLLQEVAPTGDFSVSLAQ